jgi:RND family efflux transporter MFP subunit
VAGEEGQWVKTGDVLARLDDKEANLAVERASLALDVAKREADRADSLGSQGFMSAKDHDDLVLKCRTAEVELEQARYNLGLTRVVAPFAGRIVERDIHLGETVTPGKSCFTIVDFDPVRARLYFPERDLPAIKVGQHALLTLELVSGRGVRRPRLAGEPGRGPEQRHVQGDDRAPQCERHPAAGRVRARAAQDRQLREHLLLPRRGVMSEDGEDYVFVARGDSAVRVSVKVGAIENDTAQITAGLARGERVVTVGQGGLKQGSKIRVVRS